MTGIAAEVTLQDGIDVLRSRAAGRGRYVASWETEQCIEVLEKVRTGGLDDFQRQEIRDRLAAPPAGRPHVLAIDPALAATGSCLMELVGERGQPRRARFVAGQTFRTSPKDPLQARLYELGEIVARLCEGVDQLEAVVIENPVGAGGRGQRRSERDLMALAAAFGVVHEAARIHSQRSPTTRVVLADTNSWVPRERGRPVRHAQLVLRGRLLLPGDPPRAASEHVAVAALLAAWWLARDNTAAATLAARLNGRRS